MESYPYLSYVYGDESAISVCLAAAPAVNTTCSSSSPIGSRYTCHYMVEYRISRIPDYTMPCGVVSADIIRSDPRTSTI